MLRPPGLPAWRSPAPVNVSVVLFDGPRSAEPPRSHGTFCASDVQHFARGVAPRHSLRIGREDREVPIPARGQLAPLHLIDLGRQLGILGAVGGKEILPCPARVGASLAHAGGEVLAHTVGHEERRVFRPAVDALGQADFLVAERLAVRGGGALPVGRAVADAAVEDDEGRPALGLLEDLEGVLDAIDVVGVADAQHVPPVGDEPGRDVLGERQVRAAFDRDVVVVEDPAEVIEAKVTRERRRFGADAFHQAAVAAHGVDVVVEQLEARTVVAIGEPALGDGHADAGGDALAERPGGRLDARHHPVFRMPGGLAAELTEMADVVERDRRIAEALVVGIHRPRSGEVQHRPEQHRGVPVREDEAVAIGPDRIMRIEAHDAIPKRVDQRRERHRRPRVPELAAWTASIDRVRIVLMASWSISGHRLSRGADHRGLP